MPRDTLRMTNAASVLPPAALMHMGYTMKAENGVGEVRIQGYIDTTSKDFWTGEPNATSRKFAEDLKALGNIHTLNVYINSPGGVLYEGMAMRSELLLHKANQKNIYVMGLCASAATLPAALPKGNGVTVKMVEGALMLIHNPSVICWGTAADIQKEVDMLHKLEEDVASVYMRRSGLPENEVRSIMDAETWMTAQDAVDKGFADEVVEDMEADSSPRLTMGQWEALGFQNVPSALVLPEDPLARQTRQSAFMSLAKTYMREPTAPSSPTSISNAAPAATENTMQTKGRKPMTREQLMQEHPELCEALRAEGAATERARMQELDEVYTKTPEQAKLVHDAKYGEKSQSAAELCLALNAQMRQEDAKNPLGPSAAYMAARAAETAAMLQVGAGSGAGLEGGESQTNTKAATESAAAALAAAAEKFKR